MLITPYTSVRQRLGDSQLEDSFFELVTTQTVNDKLHLPNKLEMSVITSPSDIKRGQTTETEANFTRPIPNVITRKLSYR